MVLKCASGHYLSANIYINGHISQSEGRSGHRSDQKLGKSKIFPASRGFQGILTVYWKKTHIDEKWPKNHVSSTQIEKLLWHPPRRVFELFKSRRNKAQVIWGTPADRTNFSCQISAVFPSFGKDPYQNKGKQPKFDKKSLSGQLGSPRWLGLYSSEIWKVQTLLRGVSEWFFNSRTGSTIFWAFSANVHFFRPYSQKALGIHWGGGIEAFWSNWANFRASLALESCRNPYKCVYLLKENVVEHCFMQWLCSSCQHKRNNGLVKPNKKSNLGKIDKIRP